MILLCRRKTKDGQITYILFDKETRGIKEATNPEVIELINAQKIDNAKLENLVIKVVDGNKSTITLSEPTDVAYYIFDTSTLCSTDVFHVVDSNGEILIMSSNVAIWFFQSHILINGTVNSKSEKIIINKGKKFTSPLSRPLNHVYNIH